MLEHFSLPSAVIGALSVLVVMAALLLLNRIRLKRLEARERELRRIVEEKIRDLEDAKEKAREASSKLEGLLRHDLLTGVANRAAFTDTLPTEWRRGRRDKTPLAVIFFAIDDFKAFDEEYGPQAGDDCLCRTAAVLRNGLRRAGDLLARWGGAMFVVLLPSTGLEGAVAVAKRLAGDLEAAAIPHVLPAPGSTVSVSAGVASVIPGAGPSDELMAAADSALREARRRGRQQIVTPGEVARVAPVVQG